MRAGSAMRFNPEKKTAEQFSGRFDVNLPAGTSAVDIGADLVYTGME